MVEEVSVKCTFCLISPSQLVALLYIPIECLIIYAEFGFIYEPYSYSCFAACAPILLPARVVQALNLNVHALGVQISPPQGLKSIHVLILHLFFLFHTFIQSLYI